MAALDMNILLGMATGDNQRAVLEALVGLLRRAGVERTSELAPLFEEGPLAVLWAAFPDAVEHDPAIIEILAAYTKMLPGLARMERRLSVSAGSSRLDDAVSAAGARKRRQPSAEDPALANPAAVTHRRTKSPTA